MRTPSKSKPATFWRGGSCARRTISAERTPPPLCPSLIHVASTATKPAEGCSDLGLEASGSSGCVIPGQSTPGKAEGGVEPMAVPVEILAAAGREATNGQMASAAEEAPTAGVAVVVAVAAVALPEGGETCTTAAASSLSSSLSSLLKSITPLTTGFCPCPSGSAGSMLLAILHGVLSLTLPLAMAVPLPDVLLATPAVPWC
mmetsp:Transcript_74677/g.148416  ORF Transcript_74677/g.148416 Transcript_74677/m.148416 type:complete len:202 (-) Transcript_74677:1569-2174(-)